VFVSFDGSAFSGAYSHPSAFNPPEANRAAAANCLIELAAHGARLLVLLYDSGKASSPSLLGGAPAALSSLLDRHSRSIEAANAVVAAKNARLERRVKKIGAAAVAAGRLPLADEVAFDVVPVASVASLALTLQSLPSLQQSRATPGPGAAVGARQPLVTVLLLEDLSRAGVVPSPPPLPELEEEDDDAPLPVGQEEFALFRQAQWDAQAPHLVPVSVPGSATEAVSVYSNPTAAAAQLAALVHSSVWVDQCIAPPSSSLSAALLSPALPATTPRVLHSSLQRVAHWVSVVTSLSRAPALTLGAAQYETAVRDAQAARARAAAEHEEALEAWNQAAAAASTAAEAGEAGEAAEAGEELGPAPTLEDIAEPTPPPLLPLSRHLAALFPSLASAAAAAAAASSADAGADAEAAPAPALVVIVGGQCRADKFVVLDRLLEEVRFIAALLLPFLSLPLSLL